MTAFILGGMLIPVVITLNPPRIERAEVGAAGFDDAASGAWNIGTTWGGACAASCVEGTDYPGASDTALIDGFTVTLTAAHNVSSTTVATGGTLKLDTFTLSVGSAFNKSTGTLVADTGTINMTGESAINYSSAFTLHHLTLAPAGATTTLTADGSATMITVRGLFTTGTGAATSTDNEWVTLTGTTTTPFTSGGGDIRGIYAFSMVPTTAVEITVPGTTYGESVIFTGIAGGGKFSFGGAITVLGDLTFRGSVVANAALFQTNSYALTVGNGSGDDFNVFVANPVRLFASSSAITVTGKFSMNGLTGMAFEMTDGSLTVGEGFVFSTTAAVNLGTSTTTLNGTADQTITTSSKHFYNLVINNSGADGSDDIILSGASTLPFYVDGRLQIDDGDLNIGSGGVLLGGDVSIGASGSWNSSNSASSTILNGTGVQTWTDLTAAGQNLGNILITATSGALTVSLQSNAKASSTRVNTGDTLALNARTFTIAGSGTGASQPFIVAGTLNPGTGTTTYAGTATTDIENVRYHGLEVNGSGTTFQLSGETNASSTLAITAGTLDVTASDYPLVLGGGFVNSGAFTSRSGTTTFAATSGTADITTGASAFNAVRFDDSGGSATFRLADKMNASSTVTVTGGTFDVSGGNYDLVLGGDFTNSDTFTARSGNVRFVRTTGTSTITSGASAVNALTIDDSGGSGTLLLGGQLNASSTVTVTGGNLDGNAQTLVADGDFTNSDTFRANAGTVRLIGNSNLAYGTGITFYNLTAGNAGATTTLVSSTSDAQTVVTNVLTIGGGAATSTDNEDVNLSGSGTPFVVQSGGDVRGINEFIFSGSSATDVPSATYGLLHMQPPSSALSPTFTATGNITTTSGLIINSQSDFFSASFSTAGYNLSVGSTTFVGYSGFPGGLSLGASLATTSALTFAANGSSSLSSSGTLAVTGDLTIGASGTISLTGTTTLAGTADQTITTGSASFTHLLINNSGPSGSDDILLSGTLDVNGNLTIRDGDFTPSTAIVRVAGNFNIESGGSVDNTSMTFRFDGSATSDWVDSTSGGQNLGAVIIDGSSKTVNLGGNAFATSTTVGANDALGLGGYTLTISGSGTGASQPFIVNGTFNEGTGTTTYTGSSTTDIEDETYYGLQVNGSGVTYQLSGVTNASSTLLISAGTLDATSNNYGLILGSNFTNAGAFNPRSATTTFAATSGSHTITSGGSRFNTVRFDDSGGSATFRLGDQLNASSTVTIAGGALDVTASDYPLIMDGDFRNSDTFTPRTGTTTFSSAVSQTLTSGGSSLYNVHHTGAGQLIISDATALSGNLTNAAGGIKVNGLVTPTGNIINSDTIVESGSYLRKNGASLTLDKESYDTESDTSITLTLVDQDENLVGTTTDSANGVTVTISSGSDSEAVTLTESGNATYTFTATISLASGSATANNGTLEVPSSGTIAAAYTDQEDGADSALSDAASVSVPSAPSSSASGSSIGGGPLGLFGGSGISIPSISPQALAPIVGPVLEAVSEAVREAASLLAPILPGIFQPKAPPLAAEPPSEAVRTDVTPPAFAGQWKLLNTRAIGSFAFAPLPESLSALIVKFPELEETFAQVGVARFSDVEKLEGVPLRLPSFSEVADIPTEVIFASAGRRILDYNLALDVTRSGELTQRLNAVSGQTLELSVRPEHPAASVHGYLTLKESVFSEDVETIPAGSLTAKLIMSRPVFAQSVSGEVNIEDRLLLVSFDYADPDRDGVYTAELRAPLVAGNFEVITIIDYEDSKLGKKELRLTLIVDPEGYIYSRVSGGELRIQNAVVTIYSKNDGTGTFEIWNAREFQQVNPQTTEASGEYSFLVPPGTYYLAVEAPGYEAYVGEAFPVVIGSGVHQNIELVPRGGIFRRFNWAIGGVALLALLLLYNFYRDRARLRSAS